MARLAERPGRRVGAAWPWAAPCICRHPTGLGRGAVSTLPTVPATGLAHTSPVGPGGPRTGLLGSWPCRAPSR